MEYAQIYLKFAFADLLLPSIQASKTCLSMSVPVCHCELTENCIRSVPHKYLNVN